MMKKYKKIFKITIIIILVFIMALNIKISNNIVLFFGYSKLNVVSGSMSPTINVGDMILIKESKNYDVGDIITFKEDDSFVTHRIVKKESNGFVTKGDFNNKNDNSIVTNDKIIGKVVHISPSLGKKASKVNNPVILIAIFLIGIIIVMLIPTKKKTESDKIKIQ